MKNAIYFIFIFIALVFTGSSTAFAQAGPTTLFVGTTGDTPNQLRGYGISTSQIDPILNQVPTFGPTYTRDVANDAFADLANLKQNIRLDLIAAINSINNLSVNSFQISANPIRARLSQTGTSVHFLVGEVEAFADVTFDLPNIPFVVGDCRAVVSISKISVRGSYNVNTGAINNRNISYTLDQADVDCGLTLLGLFESLFINEQSRINNALQGAVSTITNMANIETLFSIQNFLEGLRGYTDRVEQTINNFPSSVNINTAALGDLSSLGLPPNITIVRPQIQQDISDELDNAIDIAQNVVNTFPGTSLQLDITVYDGPTNQISFVVSNSPVQITSIYDTTQSTFIELNVPPNTDNIQFYSRSIGNSYWLLLPVTQILGAPHYLYNAGVINGNTEIVAVGESTIFSGLRSLPEAIEIKSQSTGSNCYPDCGNVGFLPPNQGF